MNINRISFATIFSISIIILNKAMAIETPKHTLIKKENEVFYLFPYFWKKKKYGIGLIKIGAIKSPKQEQIFTSLAECLLKVLRHYMLIETKLEEKVLENAG